MLVRRETGVGHGDRARQRPVALTAEQLRQACALSMVRRLQMLGWTTTHRADALPADLWAEQPSGTVEVAARSLKRRTWLISCGARGPPATWRRGPPR